MAYHGLDSAWWEKSLGLVFVRIYSNEMAFSVGRRRNLKLFDNYG